MKKILAFILAAAMLLSLAACGGTTKSPDPTEDPTAQTDAAQAATEAAVQDNLPHYDFTQYGNGRITIVGAEFSKDDDGEDFLRVYYDYTNTSDNTVGQDPFSALSFSKITQNGKELEDITFSDYHEAHVPEDLTGSLSVLPGCTVRTTLLVPCSPDDGIVEISCYVMIGSWVYNPDETETFTFQIDPANLMGPPAQPLVYPSITNPGYTAGWPTAGSTDYPKPCELSINGCELTRGDEGEDVLRVKLTITNLDEEARYPGTLVLTEAYQDGVSLPWFINWNLEEITEEDEACDVKLEPGEQADYTALFLLRNDNPVEIVVEQQNDEMRLGMICDVAAIRSAQQAAIQAAIDAANQAQAEAAAALIGQWSRTDSWPDALEFNADGTGIHDITGSLYPFTYTIEGDLLCLHYDDGDYTEYTFTAAGNDLVLTDNFDNQQTFVRDVEPEATEAPTEAATEETQATEAENPLVAAIVGTWVDLEGGIDEQFTFYADGTGLYSYNYEGYWEFGFTYTIDEDYVDIQYDDGDVGVFTVRIEGDNLIANNDYLFEWTLTRQ